MEKGKNQLEIKENHIQKLETEIEELRNEMEGALSQRAIKQDISKDLKRAQIEKDHLLDKLQ